MVRTAYTIAAKRASTSNLPAVHKMRRSRSALAAAGGAGSLSNPWSKFQSNRMSLGRLNTLVVQGTAVTASGLTTLSSKVYLPPLTAR